MSAVRRVYVEKKAEFAVRSKELTEEIRSYLDLKSVSEIRVLVRYDSENISDATYQKALGAVFSEPPVDILYEEKIPAEAGDRYFSVEYLPGQFDQRADSAEQCVKLLNETEEPIIRTAMTYIISGTVTDEEFEKIKSYCINPVDSRETGEEKPATLVAEFETPEDVAILEGFITEDVDALKARYSSLGLAMTFNDFLHIRNYFENEEKRNPSMTEIRVLDTYWSDHCRHTTFLTELKDVTIEDGYYRAPIEKSYKNYLETREELYKGRSDKFVSLMDIALIAMKKLRKDGKLEDMEVSDEINACSIVVPVEIDGVTEEWLVFFKNETHNHPTEIEPFGGAATCLGGAIRDPLSGRGYVYQAMRVTGAADPTKSLKDTLKGKLPQRKLTTGAAKGYSSYGNQIGLATGLVDEIYHPNYVAKRMEIGAVMGAAPRKNVIRENSDPGDIIILMGGRTGRDGIGGATGSSKVHTVESIETCGAEVQKGNAPTERKLQRLFRRPEVSSLIKKCNDFGAGGVSVAIGELAAGLQINLDAVPKKYAGLDGTELAISESQERMAIVVDPKDVDAMLAFAAEENLEAVVVAEVTAEPRLVMHWRGKEIVNVSRAFLDTNGAHQETGATITIPKKEDNYLVTGAAYEAARPGEPSKAVCENTEIKNDGTAIGARWMKELADLNVCSKKGLVEQFDSSIGASTVTMPYGGKRQLTPVQTMIAKLPVLKGACDTVTMMSYGFDPYLSSWSPYHGAIYSVVSSVAKIVAVGGEYNKIRFTFQEYFRRLGTDPKRWGEPMSALLGAYEAQMKFGLPSIGGKDSMSGSFNEIDVPPTLVSFAVAVSKYGNVVTPEFKKAGDKLVYVACPKDEYDIPKIDLLTKIYTVAHELMEKKLIEASYATGMKGIAEAVSKMSFGNWLGAKLSDAVSESELFLPAYGGLVFEVADGKADEVVAAFEAIASCKTSGCCANDCVDVRVIGEVSAEASITYGKTVVALEDALAAWTGTLEKVFPTVAAGGTKDAAPVILYDRNKNGGPSVYIAKNKVARPRVFVPVFPGTNCEYDVSKIFEQAGADVHVGVFANMNEDMIRDSVERYTKEIKEAQIIMFPGGFSAGDEPDGSGKFIANAFRNSKITDAVNDLLKQRDGLVLGICNGFQAVIKLGLVPYGEICPQEDDSPTLAMNAIGRHISKSVYTKVVTNKSPWLQEAVLGETYVIPASHGEGRFVANEAWLKRLKENGQIATQYVDLNGNPTMDVDFNPNGSYWAIEGITSPDGRVLGKMAHTERIGAGVALNIYGEQNQRIIESGVKYFK